MGKEEEGGTLILEGVDRRKTSRGFLLGMRNGVVFTLLVVRKTYFAVNKETQSFIRDKEAQEVSLHTSGVLSKLSVVLVLVLVFIFLQMDLAEVKQRNSLKKKPEKSMSPICFSSRAKVTPQSERLSSQSSDAEKRIGNSSSLRENEATPVADQNGVKGGSHFWFRPGFLIKRKHKDISCEAAKANSLLNSVDLTKSASPVAEGNVSVVYRLFNEQDEPSAIFKPYSKGTYEVGSELALSTKVQCLNEVCAYEFDQMLTAASRAGIPETRHIKLPQSMFASEAQEKEFVSGSLQKFVSGAESCDDFGPSLFSKDDVHRIGILDLRILNCDRHTGNMMFNMEEKRLIPIDHALSFPSISFTSDEEAEDNLGATISRDLQVQDLYLKNVSFDWMLFPQAKEKFSPELLETIDNLDISTQIDLMAKRGMSFSQRLAVYTATTVLKIGALKYGKTLYELGSIVQRTGARSTPSVLEQLVLKTVASGVDVKTLLLEDEVETKKFCDEFVAISENFFEM